MADSEYQANNQRYDNMQYHRCGRSGLKLPQVSLGLWHNFGGSDNLEAATDMLLSAFDCGVTHFDLANNYGPPPGSAERFFGKIVNKQLSAHRDELIISSKAGYGMWEGPYGDWGSRKYLVASLDQSLKRMQLDYVDIFYHHRPDPNTPLQETMSALDHIVRTGKALYIGLSNYNPEQLAEATSILSALGTPCIITQPLFNMFNREIEHQGLLLEAEKAGIGCVPFSPLAQGLLSKKYLGGIPDDSRANNPESFLQKENINESVLTKVKALDAIAQERAQSLPQLAISWLHSKPAVCSCIIGASKPSQIRELAATANQPLLSLEHSQAIDAILEQ